MDYDADTDGVKRKTCSYCFVPGHTRKTCEYMKSDRSFLIEANLKYRKLIAEKLINLGLCPGALVDITGRVWSDKEDSFVSEEELALIREIKWGRINFTSSFILEPHVKVISDERVIRAKLINSEEVEVMTLPYDTNLTPFYKMYESYKYDPNILWHHGHKIVSGISSHIVESVIPPDFLSVEASAKFVDGWLAADPYSKNKKKRRSRAQVKLQRFGALMGKSKTLAQEEKVFYERIR